LALRYLKVDGIQGPHGRAPAIATAIKRLRPEAIVITYQGDGDLAAIGTNEIIHAANRGEMFTVIFVNNAVYGMTGGQMAPTTLVGQRSTTTPTGRATEYFGYPLRVCELLNTLEAPVYLERVSLHDVEHIAKTRAAIKKALLNQIEGRGFSLVEVLSNCPTNWKMTPEESWRFVKEEMTKVFPLGVFRDR
jgi:pyruvate/2-oxoacid:ferredoxin oxidoreductase beta subunit